MRIENELSEKILYFFQNLDKYYLDISKGHRKFNLLNTDSLKQGALIEVEETAGGQYVKHKYQLVEIGRNFIRLISDPSKAEILGGLITILVRTTVEFEISANTISLKLTLVFKNGFSYSIANLMGAREIWSAHVKEEMEGAARIIKSDKFTDVVRSRRSVRKFSDQEVENKKIQQFLNTQG